jgi:hypothetical protein
MRGFQVRGLRHLCPMDTFLITGVTLHAPVTYRWGHESLQSQMEIDKLFERSSVHNSLGGVALYKGDGQSDTTYRQGDLNWCGMK